MKGLYDWLVEPGKQEAVRRLADPLGTGAQATEPAIEHSHHWTYTVDAEVRCAACGARPDEDFWAAITYSFARTWAAPRGMATSEGRKRRECAVGETHP